MKAPSSSIGIGRRGETFAWSVRHQVAAMLHTSHLPFWSHGVKAVYITFNHRRASHGLPVSLISELLSKLEAQALRQGSAGTTA